MAQEVNDDVDAHFDGLHIVCGAEILAHPPAVEVAGGSDGSEASGAWFELCPHAVIDALHVRAAFWEIEIDVEDFVVQGDFSHRTFGEKAVDHAAVIAEETVYIIGRTYFGARTYHAIGYVAGDDLVLDGGEDAIVGVDEAAAFEEFAEVFFFVFREAEMAFGGHENKGVLAHIVEVGESDGFGLFAGVDVGEVTEVFSEVCVADGAGVPDVVGFVHDGEFEAREDELSGFDGGVGAGVALQQVAKDWGEECGGECGSAGFEYLAARAQVCQRCDSLGCVGEFVGESAIIVIV